LDESSKRLLNKVRETAEESDVEKIIEKIAAGKEACFDYFR
jgi:hypothetical protein